MTGKTYQMTASGPRKTPGWFSWRHQTRDAHEAASARYRATRGRAARKTRADERAAIWATLSDGEKRQVKAANERAYRASRA